MKEYYDRFVSWCRRATLEELWGVVIAMVFMFAVFNSNWLAAAGWIMVYIYNVKKSDVKKSSQEKETDITPD